MRKVREAPMSRAIKQRSSKENSIDREAEVRL
jgi:hypothetical protein